MTERLKTLLSGVFGTPFSDLWLPTVLIGLVLIAMLLAHWLWCELRVKRLQLQLQQQTADSTAKAQFNAQFDPQFDSPTHALAFPPNDPPRYFEDASQQTLTSPPKHTGTQTLQNQHNWHTPTTTDPASQVHQTYQPSHAPRDFSHLVDLHTLTAQRNPVHIETFPIDDLPRPIAKSHVLAADLAWDETALTAYDPLHQTSQLSQTPHLSGLSASTQQDTHQQDRGFTSNTATPARSPIVDTDDASAQSVFIKPVAPPRYDKVTTPTPVKLHPQFHCAARLTWGEPQGKQVLSQLLTTPDAARHWGGALPLDWLRDPSDDNSILAAWQVINRRTLATNEDALGFKKWCEQIATLGAARYQPLSVTPWESLIDDAHSLLISLDCVIVLKVSVPLVQLDLFAQSLLAARFTQVQEHWQFQDTEQGAPVLLERLWQQNQHSQQDQTLQNSQNAVFQLIIDIPHLDSLEARKVYMRLRAVARASAAILQSAQGAHLSEGMLDRYSRELLLKQEALSKADVEPGSTLARQVFHPYMQRNSDLEVVAA